MHAKVLSEHLKGGSHWVNKGVLGKIMTANCGRPREQDNTTAAYSPPTPDKKDKKSLLSAEEELRISTQENA